MAQARQPQQQQQPPAPPQFTTQSFSPPVSSPSPHAPSPVNGAAAPPPLKRPRLSPLPHVQGQSPYASPSFGAMQLPQVQTPMNGTAPNSTPSTPIGQPPAVPGTMGPPSRPADKNTDAAELTDVLASSGIDVREEEAFLTRSFSGTNAQAQPVPRGQAPQQPPPINTSFASHPSAGTLSASSSFGDLPNIKPVISEPAPQTPVPFKDPNQPTRPDTIAARRSQYHLQEPFLLARLLEQRIQKRGYDIGVRIPSEGLFHPVPGRPQPIEVTGPDGSSVVRTGQTILNQEGAPLVDILNLMSLSCEERIRGVIDYASSLASSRRAHSHGAVPDEWQDVVQPPKPVPENISTPSKRPRPESEESERKPTAAERLCALRNKEVAREKMRAAKRAKRSADATVEELTGNRADSVGIAGSAPSTPVPERAPSFDKKSVSKKEAKKMIDSKASEAQQHQQSVETARMATNSMLSGRKFGGKKTYSWLKPGGSSSGFSSPARPGPSTPTATPDKASRPGDAPAGPPKPRLGTWREDEEKGAGIQLRDVLFMLEADTRSQKHLHRGYAKVPKENRDQ